MRASLVRTDASLVLTPDLPNVEGRRSISHAFSLVREKLSQDCPACHRGPRTPLSKSCLQCSHCNIRIHKRCFLHPLPPCHPTKSSSSLLTSEDPIALEPLQLRSSASNDEAGKNSSSSAPFEWKAMQKYEEWLVSDTTSCDLLRESVLLGEEAGKKLLHTREVFSGVGGFFRIRLHQLSLSLEGSSSLDTSQVFAVARVCTGGQIVESQVYGRVDGSTLALAPLRMLRPCSTMYVTLFNSVNADKDGRAALIGHCALSVANEAGVLRCGHLMLRVRPGETNGIVGDGTDFVEKSQWTPEAEALEMEQKKKMIRTDCDGSEEWAQLRWGLGWLHVELPSFTDGRWVVIGQECDNQMQWLQHPTPSPKATPGEDDHPERAFVHDEHSSQPMQARRSQQGRAVLLGPSETEPSPLEVLSEADRLFRWEERDASDPLKLSGALQVCDLNQHEQRKLAHALLADADVAGTRVPQWRAIHLLAPMVSDYLIREFAMRSILAGAGQRVAGVAFPLLSVLTFQAHEFSPAAVQLIRWLQSEANPVVRRKLFWASRAIALSLPSVRGRFEVMVEMLQTEELARHAKFIDAINVAASRKDRKAVDSKQLFQEAARLSENFALPSGVVPGVLDLDKCRVLSSNAAPLLLRFTNPGIPAYIAKFGDHLSQDQVVMNVAQGFNMVWTHDKVNAEIQRYDVYPTGFKVGIIEVVPDCSSLGKIQKNWSGAFDNSAITRWLKAQEGQDYPSQQKRFARSLAGAVVLEHILGLGDRHCDNILLRPDGTIFHIDFGCAFGRDWGVAQKIPFTLTTQMVAVLDGADSPLWKTFVDTLVDAFMAVRQHHVFFTGYLMASLAGAIPHLSRINDVHYVHSSFILQVIHTEAQRRFRTLVDEALSSKMAQVNDSLHTFYMQHFYKQAKASK